LLLQIAGAVIYWWSQLRKDREMTDQEKIDLLGEALNNLMQSADSYIDEGSWLDELLYDIGRARDLLKKISITE
jgi:hypothetical protein